MPPFRPARGNRAAGRTARARRSRSNSPTARSDGSSSESRRAIALAKNRRDNRARRISPPQPPPPVLESYWPTIRHHIDNGPANQASLQAVCPICHDELPVRGLNPNGELLQHEPGVVISCGHVFCWSCLKQSFKAQVDQGQARTCPVCRTKMECDKCGLQSRMINLPKEADNANDYATLPQTVPEGGEKLDMCLRCEARGWWIFLVEQGRHGNEPSHIEAGFGRLLYDLMDEMENSHVPCGMAEMEQVLFDLLQRKFVELRRKREQYIDTHVLRRLKDAPNVW